MIKKVFPILAFCLFTSTLGTGIVAPLLPLYAKNMGATGLWLGIIIASFAVSNSITVPIAGQLSDRNGRKAFLIAGLLAYAVTSVGYIFANSVPLLAWVRAAQGIAGAVIIPIAMSYLGDLCPKGEEGRWMGYGNAAFFSGFGLGPLMGGILTERFGSNATFFTMGGLNLLAAIVALALLPESSRRGGGTTSLVASLRNLTTNNVLKGLFSFRMALAIGNGGLMTFVPVFAAAMGFGTSLIGILLTVNVLATTLITPLGGLIADRFNRRSIIIIGSFLGSIALVTIAAANSFGFLLIVMLIQGICSAMAMPAATALIVEEGRKYGMGSTMGIFFLAMGVGMSIGPIASGGIADLVSVDWVFYFGSAAGLIGTAFFIWFTRQYGRVPAEVIPKTAF